MSKEEHKKIHMKLHHSLDELVADIIQHTTMLPSKTTVMELMTWSAEQMANPTEE